MNLRKLDYRRTSFFILGLALFCTTPPGQCEGYPKLVVSPGEEKCEITTGPDPVSFAETLPLFGNDSADAICYYQSLLNNDPGDDNARYELGVSLKQAGRYREALESFMSIKTEPARSDANEQIEQLISPSWGSEFWSDGVYCVYP
jgi:tetratricopeptide (TPR) repeat protein